ncbi:hypothetical protein ACFYXH_37480 [Streptomyces sp. NPDC002730]
MTAHTAHRAGARAVRPGVLALPGVRVLPGVLVLEDPACASADHT